MQGAVFAVPIMHHAGLPPDKNKRFRSFRSNTAFLHPILLSSHILLFPFFGRYKKVVSVIVFMDCFRRIGCDPIPFVVKYGS